MSIIRENGQMAEQMSGSQRMKGKSSWIRQCLAAGKRLLFLAAVFCVLTGQKAYGDMIWTPEDSFLEEHGRECEYVGRRYYANGPKGYIRVMKKPGNADVIDYIANGPVFYVSMAYDNGSSRRWGLVQYHMDEEGIPVEDYGWETQDGAIVGWIDMAHLTAVYDNQSFMEEHAAQITEVDEATAPKVSMPKSGVIYLWQYPGSGVSGGSLESLLGEMQIDKTYEDSDGILWGYAGYYYGHRNFWINLSDPGEENPAVYPPQEPDLTPAVSREKLEALAKSGHTGVNLTVAVACLIALTTALSAGLIYKMASKK